MFLERFEGFPIFWVLETVSARANGKQFDLGYRLILFFRVFHYRSDQATGQVSWLAYFSACVVIRHIRDGLYCCGGIHALRVNAYTSATLAGYRHRA